MTKIFICYARKDIKQVKTIVGEINKLGFDYWMDTRNLQSGEIWTKEIAEAILACDKFLLFISLESMASDNVRREAQLAYDNNKTFVLLRLEDAKIPSHLTYQLAGIQWIEYSTADWKSRLSIALGHRSKPVSNEVPTPEKPITPITPFLVTSVLEHKRKIRSIQNISREPVEIRVVIFKETLEELEVYLDTGDLGKLNEMSLGVIKDDILAIIKGFRDLSPRLPIGFVTSTDAILEYLRNTRDGLQTTLDMFKYGKLGASNSKKLFTELRSVRENIAEALRYFTPRNKF